MLRTPERIVDDLDAWQARQTRGLTVPDAYALARLLHELRALERGHDSQDCEQCQQYDINQLSADERIVQADALRVRILREGYPLPDVVRSTYEAIRRSLITGTRRAQTREALGWTDAQITQRLWDLFPQHMKKAGKHR